MKNLIMFIIGILVSFIIGLTISFNISENKKIIKYDTIKVPLYINEKDTSADSANLGGRGLNIDLKTNIIGTGGPEGENYGAGGTYLTFFRDSLGLDSIEYYKKTIKNLRNEIKTLKNNHIFIKKIIIINNR